MAKAKVITIEQARAAKPRALEVFGRLAQLNGVGITRIGDGYGLKINLQEPPSADADLPANIGDVPVQIEIIGPIRKRTGKKQG